MAEEQERDSLQSVAEGAREIHHLWGVAQKAIGLVKNVSNLVAGVSSSGTSFVAGLAGSFLSGLFKRLAFSNFQSSFGFSLPGKTASPGFLKKHQFIIYFLCLFVSPIVLIFCLVFFSYETTMAASVTPPPNIRVSMAEQAAFESAVEESENLFKDGNHVNKGDQIAIVGNSGAPTCSTGTHLHFEIREENVTRNPADYLESISVVWKNGKDGHFSFNGDWAWPVGSPVVITQGYGMTGYARNGAYGGATHTGIDMVPKSSLIIRAPKEGTFFKGTVSCRGNPMNFVAIDHGDGLVSWYWHVEFLPEL